MQNHKHRNKIAYRGQLREVIGQGSNKYQIKYGRKILTLMVDPYSGAVSQ